MRSRRPKRPSERPAKARRRIRKRCANLSWPPWRRGIRRHQPKARRPSRRHPGYHRYPTSRCTSNRSTPISLLYRLDPRADRVRPNPLPQPRATPDRSQPVTRREMTLSERPCATSFPQNNRPNAGAPCGSSCRSPQLLPPASAFTSGGRSRPSPAVRWPSPCPWPLPRRHNKRQRRYPPPHPHRSNHLLKSRRQPAKGLPWKSPNRSPNRSWQHLLRAAVPQRNHRRHRRQAALAPNDRPRKLRLPQPHHRQRLTAHST